MQRTPEAELAAQSPPSCLLAFNLAVLPPVQRRNDPQVAFELACKACGCEVFEILTYPTVAQDPSPYADVAPGEVFYRPPHSLRCAACSDKRGLFDGRTQGYDGVLNGGFSYDSGSDGEAAAPGKFKVAVAVAYNIELEELQELAAEANVSPSDLFDWITIAGTVVGDGEDVELL